MKCYLNQFRGLVQLGLALGLSMVLSGCFYIAAYNDIQRDGSHPWWCSGSGTTIYTNNECLRMSAYFDSAVALANQYPTVADFTAAGASAQGTTLTNVGEPYSTNGVPGPDFDPLTPFGLLYAGTSSSDRVVGAYWAVMTGAGAPEGFPGDHDVWTEGAAGIWILTAWVVRGYENHPDVFAAGHPCLEPGVTLTSTSDQCFIDSHTVPLEILVTNDDGIGSEGIDAVVQGLKTVSGVTFNIVAPATQQSGSGGSTTSGALSAAPGNTISGDLGTAVDGFPADAVIYALRDLQLSPDLTMSGINEGQNLASIGNALSGTIGAARRSLKRGVPSLALSQGESNGVSADYPAGVAASLGLLERWRLGQAGIPFMQLPNLNIPSCNVLTDTISGTVDTVVGVNLDSGAPLNGRGYFGFQDCSSTKTVFVDDLDAFLNGWTSIADMGKVQPPNYP